MDFKGWDFERNTCHKLMNSIRNEVKGKKATGGPKSSYREARDLELSVYNILVISRRHKLHSGVTVSF